jgi:hypothetical protein
LNPSVGITIGMWNFCCFPGMTRSAYDVKVQLSKLGQELELIHAKGAIDDIEQWIEANTKVRRNIVIFNGLKGTATKRSIM